MVHRDGVTLFYWYRDVTLEVAFSGDAYTVIRNGPGVMRFVIENTGFAIDNTIRFLC